MVKTVKQEALNKTKTNKQNHTKILQHTHTPPKKDRQHNMQLSLWSLLITKLQQRKPTIVSVPEAHSASCGNFKAHFLWLQSTSSSSNARKLHITKVKMPHF